MLLSITESDQPLEHFVMIHLISYAARVSRKLVHTTKQKKASADHRMAGSHWTRPTQYDQGDEQRKNKGEEKTHTKELVIHLLQVSLGCDPTVHISHTFSRRT